MYDERKILRDRSREQIDADLWGFSFDALFSLPVKMNPSYAHFRTFLAINYWNNVGSLLGSCQENTSLIERGG